MFPAILRLIHERIRTRQYVVTIHADEEMDENGLSIYDVEHVILNGAIVERQKDREWDEWKCLIRGQTYKETFAVVVTKFGATDKLVIITVYAD